jgi:hypothetical protein
MSVYLLVGFVWGIVSVTWLIVVGHEWCMRGYQLAAYCVAALSTVAALVLTLLVVYEVL